MHLSIKHYCSLSEARTHENQRKNETWVTRGGVESTVTGGDCSTLVICALLTAVT
jgi:hypothetical protein